MLGRRVFSSKKVVLSTDPALDESSNYRSYMQDWDDKHLVIKHGEIPTWFQIRQLTVEQKDVVLELQGRQRSLAIVRCVLRGVENYEIEKADGSRMTLGAPDFEDAGKLGNVISVKWMNEFNPNSTDLNELAAVGLAFSEPPLPLSKPCSPGPGE